jgi:hypothetical protein
VGKGKGPAKAAPSSGASAEVKKDPKPLSIKRAVDPIVQQVQEEMAQALGVSDAQAEMKADEVKAKLQAKLEEAHRCVMSNIDTVMDQILQLVGTSYHPVLPNEPLGRFAEVGRNVDDLTAYPVPHRVCTVKSLGLVPAQIPGEGVMVTQVCSTPHEDQHTKQYKTHLILRAKVETVSYGMFGRTCGYETEELDFNWDQFCQYRADRPNVWSMHEAVPNVALYRKRNQGYASNSRTYQSADVSNDNLFAALHLVGTRRITQGLALWDDLVVRAVLKTVFSELSAEFRVHAAGTYVVGYSTSFAELFPDDFRQALTEACMEGSLVKAAYRMAVRIVDKSVKLTRSSRPAKWLADWQEKSTLYCRLQKRRIEGLLPAFPDPFNPLNQLHGLVKRLLRPEAEASEWSQQCEFAAAAHLCQEMEEIPESQKPARDELHAECVRCARTHPEWSPVERQRFMEGAEAASSLWDAPESAVVWDEVADKVRSSAMFIKPESYGPEEVKACRNIVCPQHWLRGFTHFLYYGSNKVLFDGAGYHCVKHMTPDESARVTAEMGDGILSDSSFAFETDGSSFESLVTAMRRRVLETPVMRACARVELKPILEKFSRLMEKDWMLVGPVFTSTLRSIRRSGEYNTSGGNWVVNFCISFGALLASRCREAYSPGISTQTLMQANLSGPAAQVRARLVGKMGEVVSSVRYRFEGDDGLLLGLSREDIDGMIGAVKEAGVKMTNAVHHAWEDAQFCGQNFISRIDGTRVRRANPLNVIASLTSIINCEAQSSARDEELLVAKAMAYSQLYPEIPLANSATLAILRSHRAIAEELAMSMIANPTSSRPAHRFLMDHFAKISATHGETLRGRDAQELSLTDHAAIAYWDRMLAEAAEDRRRELASISEARERVFRAGIHGARFGSWMGSHLSAAAEWARKTFRREAGEGPPPIDPCVESVVSEELEVDVPQLRAAHRAIYEYFSRPQAGPLVIPWISTWAEKCPAMQRMRTVTLAGTREAARAKVDAAVATVRQTTTQGWARSVAGLTATVELFGGIGFCLMFALAPMWGLLTLGAAVAAAAAAYCVVRWGLGLGDRVAWWLIRGALWFCLLCTVVAWVSVGSEIRRLASAARALFRSTRRSAVPLTDQLHGARATRAAPATETSVVRTAASAAAGAVGRKILAKLAQ